MSLTIAAGQRITADALNARIPITVEKTSTESRASTTTLAADSELFLDLLAGRSYEVEMVLAVTGATGGDIKIDWAVTGGATFDGTRACIGPEIATTSTAATLGFIRHAAQATAVAYGTDGAGSWGVIRETFLVTTTTAGRITMRWAQNASSATNTNVHAASSRIRALPIA